MNAATRQYFTIDVRGWFEPMYFICHTAEERDKKLNELYERWETDDKWRVSNPMIIVEVHRYSTSEVTRGRY